MAYIPKEETITGADLTNSDGETNRQYQLSYNQAISAQMQIIVENAILQNGIDYELNTGTNTLTFFKNIWNDQNISLDYFIDDETSTAAYNTDTYNITGADLTNSDGETNRQFIMITNKNIISAQMQIIVENAILQNGIDFIFNSTSKTITFLNNMFDNSKISINCLSVKPSSYATTKNIVLYSGIGVEVHTELLGTGDNSKTSFDTEFGNIIDRTAILQYGTTNRLRTLIENTDYLIALDDGRIVLTNSGVEKLETNNLYISYMYSPKQSDTILSTYLPKATEEVDKLTGNYWGNPISRTEYFDGYNSGYPQTDRPFGTQYDEDPEFETEFKGIKSVTSVEFLDKKGDVKTTTDSSYTRFDENGRIILGNSTIPNGKRNVKIKYVAGYDEVPAMIQELTALLAGMMALVNISGGSYKDVSTYTLGRKTFSIGQVYVNIRESITQMKNRIEEITDSMGPRYGIA